MSHSLCILPQLAYFHLTFQIMNSTMLEQRAVIILFSLGYNVPLSK